MPKNPFQQQQKVRQKPAVTPPNQYETLYGLRENPFPNLALFQAGANDPRQNGEIYDEEFRREEEKRFFELFVQPPNGEQPLPIGFLRLAPQAGGRGNGKSTFLHHIMWRVNEQEWNWTHDEDDPNLFALAVHVLPRPMMHKNFFELVWLVFATMAYRTPRQGDVTLFEKVDVNLRAAMLHKLLESEPDSIAELAGVPPEEMNARLADSDQFDALLNEYGQTRSQFADAAREAVEAESTALVDPGFLEMLARSFWSLQALWDNMLMNKSVRAWQRSGATWLVDGLMPVLMAAGYRRFYLLLDEFEKIYFYQTTKKRDEFLDSFRQHFYERDSAAMRRRFISSLLTLHPSVEKYLAGNWARAGLEQLAPLDPDLIEHNSIPLDASSEDKLDHLLGTYLDEYRTSNAHKGTLYPFAPGALHPAMRAAQLFPRSTLWYAHMILRKAAQDKEPAPITLAYVERVLEGTPPPPEDDDEPGLTITLPVTDLRG